MNYPELQYISQGGTATEQYANILRMLQQGCRWVQLRWKETPDAAAITELAVAVKKLQEHYAFTFILNDHVSIVQTLDLDGVHLGLQDMPVASARRLLGPHKIIGGTANTLTNVVQRIQEGCGYVGLGPYRFTRTKKQLSPILGIEGYQQINTPGVQASGIPVYAIGGIRLEDIKPLMQTGIYGIAASGLLQENSLSQITEQLKSFI